MTPEQHEELSTHNADQMTEMNSAAAGLVFSLLSELAKPQRSTFIRLSDPGSNGHTVRYALVEGTDEWVTLGAEALGFKSWDNHILEVHGG